MGWVEGYILFFIKYLRNGEVIAVSGRLLVKGEDNSQLEAIQFCEYMKVFQLFRRLFASLNAQYLISGSFGVLQKHSSWNEWICYRYCCEKYGASSVIAKQDF